MPDHARHMRAKSHLRIMLQFMGGDQDNEEDEEKYAKRERNEKKGKQKREKKNNPFAIANAVAKREGFGEEKKERLIRHLKEKYGWEK